MSSLPIESVLGEIKSNLSISPQVILQAPPGAGKSTFLPFKMVQEKWFDGKIIMLEPRRLAAKNIAHYLASLFNESVGDSIGYRMRGESRVGKNTKLEIVTEGVLTRLLQNDPELTGVDLLIFDEFHERNLQGDLGLALALDVQESLCESLKILIMSATLDNSQLQVQLPNATFVSSAGRTYPIETIYQHVAKGDTKHNKHQMVAELVKLTLRAFEEQSGNILVFVAGIKEIKQCQTQLMARLPADVVIAPLYGALSLAEQQIAINNCAKGKRKIVIATNIAETSLTIEGITVVVDSGFERSMSYQAQSGVGKLQTQRISDASATQRAGRAGRLSAGVCYRLWSSEARLSQQSEPEIKRSELTSLMLELLNWGVNSPQSLAFITQPPQAHIDTANALLKTFGAIDNNGRITQHGQAMSALGVSPRLAHLLITAQAIAIEGHVEGIAELACLLVALLESNEKSDDDIEALLVKPSYLVRQQQMLLIKKLNLVRGNHALPTQYCGLLLAIAFPDRIAQSRGDDESYQLSSGIGASLWHASPLMGQKMLVVADLAFSERTVNSIIYKACVISLATLEEYLGHYFENVERIYWSFSAKQTKLVAEKCLMLGKLTIKKQPIANVSKKQKSDALIVGIKKSGLSVLTWSDENQQLLSRLRYAYVNYQQSKVRNEFPCFSAQTLLADLDDWLAPYLNGISKPDQLKQLDLKGALLARLGWSAQQQFEKDFPTHKTVPTGSKIKISYREDESPVLSVRLQELFGQQATPCIFEGRIKLQLALLSPARRPLQLTQDLTTFWQGAYSDVKKEMRGRYPKHYWPDDPLQAQATKRIKKHM
ncbi:ATP-dependent helicase HrpB [Psychromonas sp. Urea-02u-13]|uniref:ATP-dependent helicase HrpB n=1 Tax=Psychromonas sp. Urea-02u-13 TaxID=2058326 RepID=UPI000C34F083|nr:ATP-dependent helicase HrpB [Psychromonas sp. Urea-02u-13]PKG38085.1 ATP-dependent helicase HrpB [Psychromonas sp. Urea-02u-13]